MWGNGINFDNLAIMTKYYWNSSDLGLTLSFNVTSKRELFQSKILYGSKAAQTINS